MSTGTWSHDAHTVVHSIRIAQQTLLETRSKHCILAALTASSINTVEPRLFDDTCQMMFAAQCEVDVLPSQLFLILVSNVFAKVRDLPKHKGLASATWLPTFVMTASSTSIHHSPMETPECADQSAFSGVHSAACDASSLTAHGKEHQEIHTQKDKTNSLIAAVHYKPAI